MIDIVMHPSYDPIDLDNDVALLVLAAVILHNGRGYAVGALDRIGDDLRVRRIAADQSDVGPVQRGHHPRDGRVAA